MVFTTETTMTQKADLQLTFHTTQSRDGIVHP